LLTADDRNELKLWNAESCELLQTFTHHTSHIVQILCNSASNISASLSEEGKVFVWESATGKIIWGMTTEYLSGRSLSFTNDGKCLVGIGFHQRPEPSSNTFNEYIIDSLKVFKWNGLTGEKIKEQSHVWSDYALTTITPDGKKVLISSAHGLQEWDLSIDKLSKARSFEAIESGSYSPKTNYLVIVDIGHLQLIDLKTGQQIINTQAHHGFLRTVSWSKDEKLLITTGQDDNALKVWEIPDGRLAKTVMLDVQDVHYGSVSPTGKYFAGSGKNGMVTIWDLDTGSRIRSYSENPTYIWSIAWSADEAFVYAGHNDGTVVAWKTQLHP
jgi:WD40 repeat protein